MRYRPWTCTNRREKKAHAAPHSLMQLRSPAIVCNQGSPFVSYSACLQWVWADCYPGRSPLGRSRTSTHSEVRNLKVSSSLKPIGVATGTQYVLGGLRGIPIYFIFSWTTHLVLLSPEVSTTCKLCMAEKFLLSSYSCSWFGHVYPIICNCSMSQGNAGFSPQRLCFKTVQWTRLHPALHALPQKSMTNGCQTTTVDFRPPCKFASWRTPRIPNIAQLQKSPHTTICGQCWKQTNHGKIADPVKLAAQEKGRMAWRPIKIKAGVGGEPVIGQTYGFGSNLSSWN